ncbi:MAG TPA: N-acetyl-gamma-glutamyl-phosphate reductase [bacterium]
MTHIAIHGAAGYTGQELLRILAGHPEVSVVQVTSGSFEGRAVGEVFPGLATFYDLRFAGRDAVPPAAAEVVFLGLPHGEAMAAVPPLLAAGKRVIDLSADFRLQDPTAYPTWYQRAHTAPELLATFAYGLTEWCREEVREARAVANPGCYPTGALLAVLPALAADLADPTTLIIDAKSGVSGAGVKATETTHFVQANESLKAYRVAHHQHTPEIEQMAARVAGRPITLSFTPHLVPMNRGIATTAYAALRPGVTEDAVRQVYAERYAEAPFVRLLPVGHFPDTAQVRGSNQCHLQVVVDERTRRLIMLSAIDNLVKGASGQAVHNLNVMMGWPETTGLGAPPVVP